MNSNRDFKVRCPDVLFVKLTRDLFAIAEFLVKSVGKLFQTAAAETAKSLTTMAIFLLLQTGSFVVFRCRSEAAAKKPIRSPG